ncbi:DUF2840 domain-containing protein [Agrobacterium tumefaciens]|uniref:DUF2840 domain-containing protein n=1 Tax=Agrobacterium tumefaciens TaxID=358 RepID=A0AA44JAZ3_AGRTU|nr:DUF2840 domain-containing protein [Agrobacterium tumefaciens]NTB87889.1 DUF2840 domain-containing protein [Agrobacterium tumefaciens]NTC20105.1 DUF2840 domain-containing protein [Agrobacterium tumefaciens]NTC31136.1 DUF2840 domain-containing protein [Agrobacterium tumefaciens]|tara:strand:+ start:29 stop:493 length:465 start_codon:yes stop_codon:yes gene_type:complete
MSARTTIELTWIEDRTERWLRFGRIVQETIKSRSVRVVGLDAGSIFAFVRWAANDYGTVESRIDILQAVHPGERYSTVPFVEPGGASLLRLSGWPKVEAVLLSIDQIDAENIAPEEVCPDHWRHVHNRLSCNLEPRPYTPFRHDAWLKRRALAA